MLDETEVREVHARALNRDYQVFVALPDSYRSSNRRYPVLFVTDANYAFPVARGIAQRLAKHAGMEEVIVVGLSYAHGDTPVYSRRRDYTPAVPRRQDYAADMPGRTPAFGEAQAYGRFIAADVFPLVAANYRADMSRKIFVGHSYGSLLGLQLLPSEPRTFDHYILGSPSLWFDQGVMFEREQDYAKGHNDMPASVFFGIGGRETLGKDRKRSRTEENADMVADLCRLRRCAQVAPLSEPQKQARSVCGRGSCQRLSAGVDPWFARVFEEGALESKKPAQYRTERASAYN
ncbi:alpha/beta hydrolase [Massilia phosphatilytica]